LNTLNIISKGKVEGLARKERIPMSLLEDELSPAAFLSRCLSDWNRLRILLFLNNGRKSVSQIVEELQLSQPLVSHHLKELKRLLLVRIERRGPFIYYEITDRKVIDIVKELVELAKGLLANRKTF
jgi:DNA-binding transcriptional ArsR family regulator